MVSIVIPWNNRKELKGALPSIVQSSQQAGGDITIINFMGDLQFLKTQIAGFEDRVKVINFSGSTHFNKSRAQNLGAKHTSYPYLFFCDCDIILDKYTIENLLKKISGSKGLFATLKGVKETDQNARKANNLVMFGYELKLKIQDGTTLSIVDNEEDTTDGTRQAPGLLMVRREDFLKVNGYNGQLNGWGWEDQDMISRLTLHAKLIRFISETALHISHDDASRMQSYQGYIDRWQSRDAMFRTALFNYDNNHFLGTYVQDAQTFSPTAV